MLEPAVLIADEPTSMLDPSNGARVIRLLKTLQNEEGYGMLVITHDLEYVLKIADRVILLANGAFREIKTSDYISSHLDEIYE